MIRFARLARHIAAFIGTRILAALEAHEETDWEQVRRDMRQAVRVDVVEWREANLDAADIEADLLAWEREYQTRSAT